MSATRITLVALVIAVLVGCSPTTAGEPKVAPAEEVDIARLADIAGEFPPEFTPRPPPAPSRVDPGHEDAVSNASAGVAPITASPRKCTPLFKPVAVLPETRTYGFGGIDDQQLLAATAYTPITVPVPLALEGCERMAFHIAREGGATDGTARLLTAPDIEGAMTFAMRDKLDSLSSYEYRYVAIIDGTTYVQVIARVGMDFDAEPLLPDLLVKAVAAVRG